MGGRPPGTLDMILDAEELEGSWGWEAAGPFVWRGMHGCLPKKICNALTDVEEPPW